MVEHPSNGFPRTLRARTFSYEEVCSIRELIADRPQWSRRKISLEVCRQLDWRRENGEFKGQACRAVLLRLHREGILQLPPPRQKLTPHDDPSIQRTALGDPRRPIEAPLRELRPVRLRCLSTKSPPSTRDKSLWKELIDRYHYLGYAPIVGAQLKFFIECSEGLLGCMGFGAAAWKTKPRDVWIGWSPSQRKQNLKLVINNTRFLILPWVRSKFLASHVLAQSAKVVPHYWVTRYSYRPVLMETFVDSTRYAGTCYKAANWIEVGQTTGRGKWDRTHRESVSKKTIFVYPLCRRPRQHLCR